MIHGVQHTVVGVEGAALPEATPPDGAQDPPVAVVAIAIAALSIAPEHAVGADCCITPPLQNIGISEGRDHRRALDARRRLAGAITAGAGIDVHEA